MKTNRTLSRKLAVCVAAASLVLGAAAQVARAASIVISDVPMAVSNLSPANVMFMLDNSGSMTNILPDAPYAAPSGITCGTATIIEGGTAAPDIPDQTKSIDARVTSAGHQQIHRSSDFGTNGPTNLSTSTSVDWGTTPGTFCFDPNLRYNARLNADITCNTDRCPSGYLDAVFTGDFLNWYFSNGGANTNWGLTAPVGRKPGTVTRFEVAEQAADKVIDSFTNNANVRPRVGLATYNNGDGGKLLVQIGQLDLAGTFATTMKNAINALPIGGNTPLAETLSDIGRYFTTPYTGNLTIHPGPSSSAVSVATLFNNDVGPSPLRSPSSINNASGNSTIAAPITSFCQRSFALVMTDGQPQGDQNLSSKLNNYKGDCPIPDISPRTPLTVTTTANSAVLTGISSTTAVSIGQNVSGPNIPAGATVTAKTSTTVTMSLAAKASGTGVSASFSTAISACLAGTPGGSPDNFGRKTGRFYESAGSDYLDDVAKALFEIDLRPDLTAPTGLTKTKPNNLATYTIGFGDVQLLEDAGLMQDAATAGGGLFFAATNANELVNAFAKAADDILSKDGSAAAVAVANANVTGSDNNSYASSYNSGTWSGDLISFPVFPDNASAAARQAALPLMTPPVILPAGVTLGEGDTDLWAPVWKTGCSNPNALVDPSDPTKGLQGCSAQTQLDTRTPSTRKIFTSDGTLNSGRQFEPTTSGTGTATVSTTQRDALNTPSATDGDAVINWLRGDRSQEITTYRLRSHVLGDIIDAEPLVIREPSLNYGDAGYSSQEAGVGAPAAFKTANSTRTRIVIQPANDGMVHAFNGATGVEEWAYVPNLIIGANLNALSKKSGFTHKYLVDATPVFGDMDFKNTAGGTGTFSSWHTIVVGGFGKGARGYYALDVTSTTASTEAVAKAKALWEFPSSASSLTATQKLNVGWTFGRPIIVKQSSQGWVVLLTSGYNNGTNAGDSGGDGGGYLYVVNARTGDVIRTIATGVGSTTTPSGLAKISAFVENTDADNTTSAVYGGDLLGNVWRFDLTDSNPANWFVAKLATLVDASSNPQPVTTEPELAKIDIGGGVLKRFVYVGTGQYLGDPDVTTTQAQTMYGLIDDLSGTPLITPLRTSLQQQTLSVVAGTNPVQRVASATAIDFSVKKGWFVDLPSSGERVNTDPGLAQGALAFTTNIPSTTTCVPGGSSFFNVLDYKTGGFLTGSTVSYSSLSLGQALASRVVLIKLPSGAIKALARKSDATTVSITVPVAGSATALKRRSWRELMM